MIRISSNSGGLGNNIAIHRFPSKRPDGVIVTSLPSRPVSQTHPCGYRNTDVRSSLNCFSTMSGTGGH